MHPLFDRRGKGHDDSLRDKLRFFFKKKSRQPKIQFILALILTLFLYHVLCPRC